MSSKISVLRDMDSVVVVRNIFGKQNNLWKK